MYNNRIHKVFSLIRYRVMYGTLYSLAEGRQRERTGICTCTTCGNTEDNYMKEKLEALLRDGIPRINGAKTEAELQEIKGRLLGKQGSLTLLMKEMGKLPAENAAGL